MSLSSVSSPVSVRLSVPSSSAVAFSSRVTPIRRPSVNAISALKCRPGCDALLHLYSWQTHISHKSPEVINALSNQLVDSVTVFRTDHILHLLQPPRQIFNVRITNSRCDTTLQDLLCSVLNVFQVPSYLTHCVVPQLEARVTLDAFREEASEATGAFIAPLSCSCLSAFARPCCPVTLGHLGAQRVAATLCEETQEMFHWYVIHFNPLIPTVTPTLHSGQHTLEYHMPNATI